MENLKGETNPVGLKEPTILKGHWDELEHEKFLEALFLFGKNLKSIQKHINTRTVDQVKSHSQKYMNKLNRQYSKDLIKSSDIRNKEAYLCTWTRDLINREYLPLVGKYAHMPDFEEKFNRLFYILLRKKVQPEVDFSDTYMPCCCNYGVRSLCDCEVNCCFNNTLDTSSVKFNSASSSNATVSFKFPPIFFIEKVCKKVYSIKNKRHKFHIQKTDFLSENEINAGNSCNIEQQFEGGGRDINNENINIKTEEIYNLPYTQIQTKEPEADNNLINYNPLPPLNNIEENSAGGGKSVFNLNFPISNKSLEADDNDIFLIQEHGLIEDKIDIGFDSEYFFQDDNFL